MKRLSCIAIFKEKGSIPEVRKWENLFQVIRWGNSLENVYRLVINEIDEAGEFIHWEDYDNHVTVLKPEIGPDGKRRWTAQKGKLGEFVSSDEE